MKIKRIMLAAILLLAILTIGVASANEGVDNITTSEVQDSIGLDADDVGISTDPDDDDWDPDEDDSDYDPDEDDPEWDPDEDEDDPDDEDSDYEITVVEKYNIHDLTATLIEYAFYDYGDGGKISIYVDGTFCKQYSINTYDEKEITAKNLRLTNLEYKNYTVNIVFSGDDVLEGFNKTYVFKGYYGFDVEYEDLNGEDDYGDENIIKQGQDIAFSIELPDEAEGVVVYEINGIEYTVPAEDIWEYTNLIITSDMLDLGENVINFTYVGEDYPIDFVTFVFNVCSFIEINQTEIPYNESAAIYLNLPADANGNLSVYKVFMDEFEDEYEYYEVATYELIKSVPLVNGFAKVLFNSSKLGDYYIYANYTGSDYDATLFGLEEWDGYDAVEVHVVPIILEPSRIQENASNNITIIMPEEYEGVLTICIGDEEDSVEVIKGRATIELFNFEAAEDEIGDGVYTLQVTLSFEDEDVYSYDTELYIPMSDFEDEFYISVQKQVLKGGELSIEFSDFISGIVIVYIDGKRFDQLEGGYLENLNVSSLKLGSHTIKFKYSGDDDIDLSSYNSTFEVVDVIMDLGEVIYVGNYSDGLWAEFASIETIYDDGYYVLLIDGEVMNMGFTHENYGEVTSYGVSFTNRDLSVDFARGAHNVTLIYTRGDDSRFINRTMDAVYDFQFNNGNSFSERENITLYFDTASNVNGNLKVTVDKEYTVPIVNGEANLALPKLAEGTYKVIVRYDGEEYPEFNMVEEIYVDESDNVIYSDIDDNDCLRYGDEVTIFADLPSDIAGKLYVYESYYNDDEGEVKIPIKTVNLVSGSATVTVSNLGFGDHWICAKIIDYDDSEMYIEDFSVHFEVSPMVNGEIGYYGESMNYGEKNLTISVELPSDANGIMYLCKGDTYDDEGNSWVTLDQFNVVGGNVAVSISNFSLGRNTFYMRYNDGKYNISQHLVDVLTYPNITYPKEMLIGESDYLTFYLPGGNGNLSAFGSKTKLVNGVGRILISDLPAGTNIVDLVYESEGDDYFNYIAHEAWGIDNQITVTKPESCIYISNSSDPLTVELNSDATGNIIVMVGKEMIMKPLSAGRATVTGLNFNSNEDISLSYTGDSNYEAFTKKTLKLGESYIPKTASEKTKQNTTTIVLPGTPNIYLGDSISILTSVFDQDFMAIDGTVDLYVNSALISTANIGEDYIYTPDTPGVYRVQAVFNGNPLNYGSSDTTTFIVIPTIVPKALNSNNDGVVTLEFPMNATGKLTVLVDGVEVMELDVEVELAKFREETQGSVYDIVMGILKIDLSQYGGNHVITFIYSGDDFYLGFRKESDVTVKVTVPSVSANNMNAVYSAGQTYTIRVFEDANVLANGAPVVVKVNGKALPQLTAINGVASFKVSQVPGTYRLTITSLGKTITKTLTVKHLVSLKTVKVKKSAKKLVLQATLGKVNGKYLKNKKITFKFKGKKYTAKTNKKGVAKVTVKSSVLKKLKVGKKVTYQATYLKDTVKKTVKVKK